MAKKHKGMFKKGESGNPSGRPALPPELNKAINMTRKDVMELLVKYLYKPVDEIALIADDETSSAKDAVVCKIIHEAVKRGDEKKLEFLFNRIIGKVDSNININGDLNTNKEIDYSNLSDEELKAFRELIRKANG